MQQMNEHFIHQNQLSADDGSSESYFVTSYFFVLLLSKALKVDGGV